MKKFVLFTLALATASGSAFAIDVVSANANLADGIKTDLGDIAATRAALNAGYGERAITAGDPYSAAIIGQTTATAAFLTNAGRVTTFTYDLLGSVHGTLVGSGSTVAISEAQVLLSPNTLRVVVQAFTTDSLDLYVSGISAGTPALPITQGRFDVGAGAFTNGLLWDNLPGAVSSVSIFSAVFVDGTNVASSSALTNGRVLPQVGSNVVWNGIVGSGVDEIWMVFDITFVPAPGAMALVGMGGLLAARRRR